MKLAALLVLPLSLSACEDLGMDRQPKDVAQGPALALPHAAASQNAPDGVVAINALQREAASLSPPPVSLALVERGRERYGVACTPCHGPRGAGDGPAVMRGFPAPPNLSEHRVTALSGRMIYDVISNGYGLMLPQAERLAPPDRWAIVAYVRALQTSPVPAGATP